MNVVGLFAGIGGFEVGFGKAGYETEMLCEIDPAAVAVLQARFPGTPIIGDIRKLKDLPAADVIAAGFPCQDLSLAGKNMGIDGDSSGLVNEIFRLVARRSFKSSWLLLENVPFMLWQKKGHAIRYVSSALDQLGFRWAYRVVDARSFGLPQRRRRVILLASRTEDPATVLFADDAGPRESVDDGRVACGFYWTEGRGGLGWAVNATPTIKGGSSIGIPSPPAIWLRGEQRIAVPDLRDAERLQGFRPGWTKVQVNGKDVRAGFRWKLVGNAVSVPVAEWVARRIAAPRPFDARRLQLRSRDVWPNAACGGGGKVFEVAVSEFPKKLKYQDLAEFLRFEPNDLSARATAGFLNRANAGSLNFDPGFLKNVESHLASMLRKQERAAMRAAG